MPFSIGEIQPYVISSFEFFFPFSCDVICLFEYFQVTIKSMIDGMALLFSESSIIVWFLSLVFFFFFSGMRVWSTSWLVKKRFHLIKDLHLSWPLPLWWSHTFRRCKLEKNGKSETWWWVRKHLLWVMLIRFNVAPIVLTFWLARKTTKFEI